MKACDGDDINMSQSNPAEPGWENGANLEPTMAAASPLTGMQQHVFDHIGEVVLQVKAKELRYDLRGREVNAQIATLVAKKLIAQDRSGALSIL